MEGNEDFHIRRATEADGDAIRKITENNPDTGDLSFAPQFEANPYRIHSARNPGAVGFIAETPDGDPAGTGFAYFITARVGGDLRQTAFLSNLAVSADYRNQGLAKRLARERISHAEQKHGDDCVIWARIQQGNEPSRAVAESWAEHFTYDATTLSLDAAPGTFDTRGYEVREADRDELGEVAEQVNEFYADAECYGPTTAEEMENLLARSPIDEPVRSYLIALDGDDIVAGVTIEDMYKAMWISIQGDGEIPPHLPADGEIRPKGLRNPWFTDGHTDAARALIEYIRANPDGANQISYINSSPHPFVSLLTEEFGADPTVEHGVALRGATPRPDQLRGKPH